MHFYSFTVIFGSELIFIVKIRIAFFLGAAATLFEAILVMIHSGSFVLSVLDGMVGISGNLFRAHARAGSEPGNLGSREDPELQRIPSECTEAGTGFHLHTSQHLPTFPCDLTSFPSQVPCTAFQWEHESLEFWKFEIWWKKAFRCGRCILMDAGKTHPNNGNYELLKIASSHLFSGMLGSQIPPLSTAPDGFREIIICCCFSFIRASF